LEAVQEARRTQQHTNSVGKPKEYTLGTVADGRDRAIVPIPLALAVWGDDDGQLLPSVRTLREPLKWNTMHSLQKQWTWMPPPGWTLRDTQKCVVEGVWTAMRKHGIDVPTPPSCDVSKLKPLERAPREPYVALIHGATAMGKTETMLSLLSAIGKRVLWVCWRPNVGIQTVQRMRKYCPHATTAVLQSPHWDAAVRHPDAALVYASPKTLTSQWSILHEKRLQEAARLRKRPPSEYATRLEFAQMAGLDTFDVVVWDEGHESLTQGNQGVWGMIAAPIRFTITATPMRPDEGTTASLFYLTGPIVASMGRKHAHTGRPQASAHVITVWHDAMAYVPVTRFETGYNANTVNYTRLQSIQAMHPTRWHIILTLMLATAKIGGFPIMGLCVNVMCMYPLAAWTARAWAACWPEDAASAPLISVTYTGPGCVGFWIAPDGSVVRTPTMRTGNSTVWSVKKWRTWMDSVHPCIRDWCTANMPAVTEQTQKRQTNKTEWSDARISGVMMEAAWVCFATMGKASTGVSFDRYKSMIRLSSRKSVRELIQSGGRTGRGSVGGATIQWDLIDMMPSCSMFKTHFVGSKGKKPKTGRADVYRQYGFSMSALRVHTGVKQPPGTAYPRYAPEWQDSIDLKCTSMTWPWPVREELPQKRSQKEADVDMRLILEDADATKKECSTLTLRKTGWSDAWEDDVVPHVGVLEAWCARPEQWKAAMGAVWTAAAMKVPHVIQKSVPAPTLTQMGMLPRPDLIENEDVKQRMHEDLRRKLPVWQHMSSSSSSSDEPKDRVKPFACVHERPWHRLRWAVSNPMNPDYAHAQHVVKNTTLPSETGIDVSHPDTAPEPGRVPTDHALIPCIV
jgi:hypothetical protein